MQKAKRQLIALTIILSLALSLTLPVGLAETPWLEDYSYRKLITVAGSAGAGTDYVVFVKVYYASGTDGFEILTGGHNGVNSTKVYLAGNVEADFDDVRYTETDGETELSYFRDTYTASTSALFAVEVSEDLEADQSFYIYFGDAGQATESNAAATFKRVISSGVALALPMNEGAGLPQDYSGNSNNAVSNLADWVTTGKFGSALRFTNGNNDYVKVTDSPSLTVTTNMSLVVYFKPTTINLDAALVVHYTGAADGWYYRLRAGDNLPWFVLYDTTGGDLLGTNPVVVNNQYTFSGTFDNAQTIMRLNDAANGNEASVGPMVDHAQDLYIGNNGGLSWDADGIFSGVFLFNETLTSTILDDFHNYYPQCSTANTGSLYLRSFVNPEPQPSTIGSLETNNRYASTNYVWMAVLLVIGFVFMGFMFLRRGN